MASPDLNPKIGPFKVVFVGETHTGKTSIINRVVNNKFDSLSAPTIGTGNSTKMIKTQNSTIELNIWDTAGQEKYQSLIPMYLKGTDICVYVIDASQKISLDTINLYYDYLTDQLSSSCSIYVCLNKYDLVGDIFIHSNIKQWCSQNGLKCLATSAKSGLGLEDLFMDIALSLESSHVTPSQSITVENTDSGCC